ncbi:MAG TPA: hypothetical protein VF077_08825 [Nitrospiraceae bacterium]
MSAERVGDSGGSEAGEADEAIVAQAKEQGWVPLDEFRGKPEKWVDAEEFIERGKQALPLLRKNNERLQSSLTATNQRLAQLEAALKARDEDIDAMQELHNEQLKERTETLRRELKAKLKAAKEDNDTDAEVEATDGLIRLNAVSDDVETVPKAKKAPPQPQRGSPEPDSPEFEAWHEQNPWYLTDPERTFEANQVAQRMVFEMQAKKLPELRGEAFFQEFDKRMRNDGRPNGSRVEGSRGGVTRTRSNGHTYSDLSREERAICDKFAGRFVKPGGKWATTEAYRKHYVAQLEEQGYFNQ